MKTQSLNVYILNDDLTIGNKLRYYIAKKFGKICNVSLFSEKEPFYKSLNRKANVVIVDDFLYNPTIQNGENVLEIVETVKERASEAQIIVLSSDHDIETAVNSIKMGASHFLPNTHGAWKRLYLAISKIALYPVHFISREFKVSRFVAIFTMVFITMLVLISVVLNTRL
jgi:DNA-binding NtrC family response regulator